MPEVRTPLLRIVLCLTVCMPGCGGATVPPPDPAYVTVGIRGSPGSLDPRIGTDESSQRVSQLVYSPLMTIDDDLRVVPHLAARLDHPDPLTYVAYLRSGVRFHDGHELTAADVVSTFGSFLDPDFASPRKAAYRRVAAVRALDERTVEFTLREPFGSFPTQLVMPILPSGAGADTQTFPIGTGPYRFVRYAVDDQVVLSAFEGYWDGLPQNAGVVLRIIPEEARRVLELRQGTVDLIVNDVPSDIARQLERDRLYVMLTPGVDDIEAKRWSGRDAPYVSLWRRTNVAVLQPGITGLRLGARADMLSLKDVRKPRQSPGRFTS